MERPVFYNIPKGSLLDEMALFFEVDKNYLKRYHNIYCELNDLIDMEIPKHLDKLFVPPKDKGFQEAFMSGINVNKIYPADILAKGKSFRKEYGIIQTLFENGKQKKRISFLTEVERVAASSFMIRRKKIYIDYKSPDHVMERLAEKVGHVFFPLQVETLENGNLKQILNVDQIRKRWKNVQPELSKYYIGKVAEGIIRKIDQELANKETIQNRILGSLFYRLYFLPFSDYERQIGKVFDLYLPLFPFKRKVRFQVGITKQPTFSETGKMVLEINGMLKDIRTFSQMMHGKTASEAVEEQVEQCKGSIDALYKFNKEDGSIYSVEAEINLESEDGKNQKKIIFELYEQ